MCLLTVAVWNWSGGEGSWLGRGGGGVNALGNLVFVLPLIFL